MYIDFCAELLFDDVPDQGYGCIPSKQHSMAQGISVCIDPLRVVPRMKSGALIDL